MPTSDSHKVLIWNAELTFGWKAAFNMTSCRYYPQCEIKPGIILRPECMHQTDVTIYITWISDFCIIPTSDSHKVLIYKCLDHFWIKSCLQHDIKQTSEIIHSVTSDSYKVLIWNAELTFGSKAAFNMMSSRHQKLSTMWDNATGHSEIWGTSNFWLGINLRQKN
jgi:hypothetical protein